MKVLVRSINKESKLEAQPSTKGRDIFTLMCKSLGLQEVWYFGLLYKENSTEVWIDKSKKTLKDLQRYLSQLEFRVKYYPENVDEELIEKITIETFYYTVKSAILKDEIFCPSDTCALLASYSLQAKFGDYNPNQHNEKLIRKVVLLPERVIKQHSLSTAEWQESIVNLWKKHKGSDEEEAMLEYLKLAQNLEMYGVKYFNIQNRKGTDVLLGVTALGLDIYKVEDKLNPQIAFPWSEIKNLKFRDRKFTIKPVDKTAKDFTFFTQSPRASKYILNLGIGNHTLYIRRRKPELPEIKRLREKAMEIRNSKSLQRLKYNTEKAAREEAERREKEYKKEIETMRKKMEEDQRTIQKLQQQLAELQKSKEELEKQRHELEEMMARLEHSKNMEAAERQKLEDEIRAKHDEVQRIQDEVQRKDEETRRLQQEVEEARRREEEIQRQKLAEAARLEELRRQQEIEEANRNEQELEMLPEGADTTLPELQQVNEQLTEQLKLLQNKLEKTRTEEKETELEKIHRVNLLQGRDKYKTLADIRRGNTVRRVEMFENM